jgi:hypothetical protein
MNETTLKYDGTISDKKNNLNDTKSLHKDANKKKSELEEDEEKIDINNIEINLKLDKIADKALVKTHTMKMKALLK